MTATPVPARSELRPGLIHEHHEAIGSTNAEALARIAELKDTVGGIWVTADRQTAGRGRRGRAWSSEPGNLFASFAFIARDMTSRGTAILPLVAALALAEAVDRVTPLAASRISLKWPNDLLLDGRKVAGILLEAVGHGDASAIVIGFGVNCTNSPDDSRVTATSFGERGLDCPATDLFAALAETMASELASASHPLGSANAVRRWRSRAYGRGADIVVRLPGEELNGTFEDMADDGRLVLRQADGTTHLIAAGDVFFDGMQGYEHEQPPRSGAEPRP